MFCSDIRRILKTSFSSFHLKKQVLRRPKNTQALVLLLHDIIGSHFQHETQVLLQNYLLPGAKISFSFFPFKFIFVEKPSANSSSYGSHFVSWLMIILMHIIQSVWRTCKKMWNVLSLSFQADSEEEEEVFNTSKESVELYCVHAREKLTSSIRLQWRRLKSHVERLDSQGPGHSWRFRLLPNQ